MLVFSQQGCELVEQVLTCWLKCPFSLTKSLVPDGCYRPGLSDVWGGVYIGLVRKKALLSCKPSLLTWLCRLFYMHCIPWPADYNETVIQQLDTHLQKSVGGAKPLTCLVSLGLRALLCWIWKWRKCKFCPAAVAASSALLLRQDFGFGLLKTNRWRWMLSNVT